MDASAIKEIALSEAIKNAAAVVNEQLKSGVGVCALPSNFSVLDLEKYMPTRRRLRGAMVTGVVKDFAAYVTLNKEEGAAIFIDTDKMNTTAVLNMGTPSKPGHADNIATLEQKRTAAYEDLRRVATGASIPQLAAAEFLEDWAGLLKCFHDLTDLPVGQAIASVRRITIESMKKVETEAKQLSASKSAFESVQATSGDNPLPTTIYFKCKPYADLPEREFTLRLGVLTSNDKPSINLRIIKIEEHEEQMGGELAALVSTSFADKTMPITIGKYSVKQ